MKAIKFILKALLYIFIGLLIAAFTLPYVFKDRMILGVKTVLNEKLNAEVDFDDASLSFFSSFPVASIAIANLKVSGSQQFKNSTLFLAEEVLLDINIPSLFKEEIPYEVNRIHLVNPQIDLISDKNGSTNWNIIKSNESATSSDYSLDLNNYELSNATIRYRELGSGFSMLAKEIDHEGSGDISTQIFDLKTKSKIESFSLNVEGIDYFNNAKVVAITDLKVNANENSYTITNNDMQINALNIITNGFIKLNASDIDFNLKIESPNENFAGVLSIIPGMYTSSFDDTNIKGNTSFRGSINGKYNADRKIYPKIDFNIGVQDGYAKYKNHSKDISNVNTNIKVSASQGNYDDLLIDIPDFSATIAGKKIAGQMRSENSGSNPDIRGFIKGEVNLEDWTEALPLEGVDNLQGFIDADIKFAGKRNDIESKKYDEVTFDGKIQGSQINIKLENTPEVGISSITSVANSKSLTLKCTDVVAGNSNGNVNVSIENPISLLIGEKTPLIELAFEAETVDLNDWIIEKDDKIQSDTTLNLNSKWTNVAINGNVNTLNYDTYKVSNVSIDARHAINKLEIKNLKGSLGKSDFVIDGELTNTMNYLNSNEALIGNLNLTSKKLDLEDFYSKSDTKEDSKTDGVVLIPSNLEMKVNASIKSFHFDEIDLSNMKGLITTETGTAVLTNGSGKGLGGLLSFDGMYDTSNPNDPEFSFKYDMSKIGFGEAVSSVSTIEQLAPIFKYIKGKFNSTLVLEGKIGDDMFPEIGSLNASGYLETLNGNLKGIDVLEKVANKLGLDELRNINLDKTKNWFEVIDGLVQLKPLKKEIDGIKLEMSGKHSLEQSMDYLIVLDVPRSKLKGNAVTGAIDIGLSYLEKEASKVGLNINQGDYIKLNVHVTGSITNPSIKIRPVSSGGKEASGSVVKDAFDDLTTTVKDTIDVIIKETEDKIKDTIESTLETVKDSVNTVIDEKVDEVLDTVESTIKGEVTDKVNSALDSLNTGTPLDSLKNDVKDILNNSGSTKDEIKDKLDKYNPFKKKKKKN